MCIFTRVVYVHPYIHMHTCGSVIVILNPKFVFLPTVVRRSIET